MKKLERVATTSERMLEAMEAANKRRIDLANETGLSHSTIGRYISGRMEPKQKAVGLLAQALNVSEMWLWGYQVPMTRTVEQKKNDTLSDVVIRMRTDEKFMSAVNMLYELDDEKLSSVTQMLTFLK